MIILMSLVTVVILASFVLPRFQVFFASLDAQLPLPTRILLAVTSFVVRLWWALLAGLARPCCLSSSPFALILADTCATASTYACQSPGR